MTVELIDKLPSWAGEKALQCVISSVDEFFEVIKALAYDSYGLWYYRGQYCSTWPLKTSLERQYDLSKINPISELKAIKEFRYLTRLHLNQTDSLIESLAAMQHYGVPTRLLDFSRSLLVALFFAFEKGTRQSDADNHALWAINFKEVFSRATPVREEIQNEVKENLDGIDSNDDYNEAKQVVTELSWDSLLVHNYDRMEKSRALADKILATANSLKLSSGLLPIDISGCNPRVAAQNGVFVMTTDFRPFEVALSQTFHLGNSLLKMHDVPMSELKNVVKNVSDFTLIKFVIGENLRSDVQKLLNAANISHPRLFPDLHGIASCINYELSD